MSSKLLTFFAFFLILSNLVESQRLFKKMTYPASTWSKMVYKSLDFKFEVKTKVECLGFCQTEAGQCNIVFFDEELHKCWLGTLGANLSIISNQATMIFGYADLGNLKNKKR
jgi:hypothetical protein